MGGRAPGVDDPFGDALMVEVHDLLAQMEVVEQRRPALADPEAVVGVVHRDTPAVVRVSPPCAHAGATASLGAPGDLADLRPPEPAGLAMMPSCGRPVGARRLPVPTRIAAPASPNHQDPSPRARGP